MRYWITPDGSYYEGEFVAIGSIEVSQRPSDLYDWNGSIWELNQQRYTARTSNTLEAAIDDYIDSVAAAKGYGKVYRDGATEACMKYASFTNKYQAEAITFGNWIVAVWDVVYQVQADVLANLRPVPTAEQLISELPTMVWPV